MHASGATGTQGMCVTKGTAERTGIKELKDLRNPEMAKKFDTNNDGKGEVWIGADGWGSTPIEQVRARSYGYDKTMNLRIMEEAVALAEVDAAVKDKKDIVFFCYTPHHMFAANELVVLSEPAYDPNKWIIVPPSPTPGWLEKSSAAVAWDTARLYVSYATALEKSQPKAAAMLSKVSLSTDTLTAMTLCVGCWKTGPGSLCRQMGGAKSIDRGRLVRVAVLFAPEAGRSGRLGEADKLPGVVDCFLMMWPQAQIRRLSKADKGKIFVLTA